MAPPPTLLLLSGLVAGCASFTAPPSFARHYAVAARPSNARMAAFRPGKGRPTKGQKGFGLPSLPSLELPQLQRPSLPTDLPNPVDATFDVMGIGGRRQRGEDARSVQVKNYEEGSDFVFFQSPSPKYAYQDDLPDYFSAVRATAHLQLS